MKSGQRYISYVTKQRDWVGSKTENTALALDPEKEKFGESSRGRCRGRRGLAVVPVIQM